MKAYVLLLLMLSPIKLIQCDLAARLIHELRDPFFLPAGNHLYSCSAIGLLNRSRIALLAIDGNCYTVKEGDSVAGHIIIAIEESSVLVRNEKGHELQILAKKGPST